MRIAVIAFDGLKPFHLSVPSIVFGSVPEEAGSFEVVVCAAERTPLRTSAGFSISVDHDFGIVDHADIVIMPTWHDDCRPAPHALLEVLRRAHERGARLLGLCLGAFPLAQAGLLDGKTATTHWDFADTLRARHPKVKVDPGVLYVDEGTVLTSGGVAAGLDCCLYLLRELRGADVANAVARKLLVAPHRQGGQAQFIERPLPVSHSDGRFAGVLEWVTRNLEQEHSLDALAQRAAMSRRHFTRHFRQATGTSFKQWLLGQRLAQARRMLERSDASIDLIADETGFGSALSLRQHFRAVLRTSPSAYRKQFRLQQAGVQAEAR